ncbi:hypothetical protein CVT25_004075 [Psilocybe cyanescens]|uniref:DUF6534 domain-containing protein n=1 Tax=Psilocybe cyanescens TaxID=93625 RepID=A0A409XQ26_PSICY|nr:hypothetical protein CVT25_004075 [Psilocybe cyanescens]
MTVSSGNTFGAAYLGILVEAILYGVTGVQTYIYLNNSHRDPRIIVTIVLVLWVLDTLHLALTVHAVYIYLVENFGNFNAIRSPTWSILVQVYIMNISDSLVRSYFAWRVFVLCGKYGRRKLGLILSGSIMSLSLVAAGSLANFASRAFALKTFEQLATEVSAMIYIGIGAAVSADILVAVCLCASLILMRTGSKGDSTVNFLLAFVINTGLLTCLVSIACLVTFLVLQQTFVWIAIFISLGKLYINALLASLNAREMVYRDHINTCTTNHQELTRPIAFNVDMSRTNDSRI